MLKWNGTVNGPFQKSKAFISSSVLNQICLSPILVVISLFASRLLCSSLYSLYKFMYSYSNGNYNSTIGWDFSGKCKLYRYYYYIAICHLLFAVCIQANVFCWKCFNTFTSTHCYNGLADTSFQRIHLIETIESSERMNLILCRINLFEIQNSCNGWLASWTIKKNTHSYRPRRSSRSRQHHTQFIQFDEFRIAQTNIAFTLDNLLFVQRLLSSVAGLIFLLFLDFMFGFFFSCLNSLCSIKPRWTKRTKLWCGYVYNI